AIEMVYNPPGGFQAGSGAISNGEFRRANDVTSSGTASTFTITGTVPTLQGNSSSSSPTNIAAYNNDYTDLTGTNTATLAAGYPTGFNAFYSMKYEISQQQYVDFLNTLTYTQQAARTATAPNNAAGTGALINPNANRNGIDIQTPGTSSTVPAVYACNLDDDGNYNEADDGQHIACNYLTWNDLTAYLDWAGLRPMTELEFEKSCRGNQSPVASEYPWGTTSATAATGLTNGGAINEIASNAGANIAFNNSFSSGPVRNGIFATSSSIRSTSGAGFYGNMELGGNLWERVVTIGTSDGRTFSATHGNGTLATSGASDVSGWPAASGSGWKGGSYDTLAIAANSSGRTQAANGNNNRAANAGGRGVRTISSGIVTDGLVLWLDAGITSSYPESGATWTDLSGNRNNGTLTNGPTYSSGNGGSIELDGSNDYVVCSASSDFDFGTGNVSIDAWIYWDGTYNSGGREIYATGISGERDQFGIFQGAGLTFGSVLHDCPACYPPINTWSYVAAAKTGTTIKLYINGVETASGTQTLPIGKNNVSAFIGFRGGDGYHPFKGNIASLKIYKGKGLTAAEITQNFNAQKARFGL
ncbi:MAG: LamG-like jellyroll fold domain-containing protein, partial [Sediminibacterium sp.]